MAARAAILKFFKRPPPKAYVRLSQNLMGITMTVVKDSESLKFLPISKMAATAAFLKFFKRYLLQNHKSHCTETLWEASERHRDSELLRLFRSNIQGGHLEILQTTKTVSWIEPKLDGSITVTQKFRIAKIVPFRYPRWPPRQPSWNSSNDISFKTRLSQTEPKFYGRHWSDIEIQNC